jgi:hypothetical protein
MGGMTLNESQHGFFRSEIIELTDKKCHSDGVRGHLLSHWQAAHGENTSQLKQVHISVSFLYVICAKCVKWMQKVRHVRLST